MLVPVGAFYFLLIMDYIEKKIKIDDSGLLDSLNYNTDLMQRIEARFKSAIVLRGDVLIVKGEFSEVKVIESLIKELNYMLNKTGELKVEDVDIVFSLLAGDRNGKEPENNSDLTIIFNGAKDLIRAKSPKQLEYHKKIRDNDIVFAIGPAGTGKTFLSVAMALASLRRNEVNRIIISRPAVEAGESLGFLPGDLKEKLDPYLRPITDALMYMVTPEKLKSMMEKNIIEITPLAYMRGRTLNNAFIILDEAQNTTITQMKMFLTRLGNGSKSIVTGDITQVDLQDKSNSGLIHVQSILNNISGIEFVYFTNNDVIRHKLVAEIIKAYEKDKSLIEKSKARTRK